MMIACCIPMLVIAVVLVATGVLGFGFVLLAVGCTAMMAMMMRGMNHGGGSDGDPMSHGVMDHDHMNHGLNRPADTSSNDARGRPDDR
jgi:hypothetical protein